MIFFIPIYLLLAKTSAKIATNYRKKKSIRQDDYQIISLFNLKQLILSA